MIIIQTAGSGFSKMRTTLRNVIYVFGASSVSKFIGLFTSFLMPRILEPANYGIWITLLLIVSYAPIVALGTVETLIKQYPYYTGRGDLTRAREVEEGVLGSIALSSLLLLIVGFSFHLLLKLELFQSFSPLILAMVIAASLSLFSAYFYYRFAAHQNFKTYSIIDTIRSFSNFIVLIPFTWLWGLKGAVLGYCFSELFLCVLSAFLSNNICGKIRINFNLKLIWNMIKIGFPITVVWWVYTLQTTAGSVISVSMLGKEEAGYYGLGGSLISMLILIPMAVGQVLYPKVSEGLGRSIGNDDMTLLVITPAQALSLILPVATGVLILLLPTIYHMVFPKYVSGLLSAQILLLGAFFMCLVRTGANFLIASGEQKQLIKYVSISLVAVIAFNISLVKLGLNIEGIALGTAFSGVLFTTLIWKNVFKSFGYDRSGQLKGIFNLYSPFLLSIGLIGILTLVFPRLLIDTSILPLICIVIFIVLFIIIILFTPPFSKTSRDLYHVIKLNVPAKIIGPVTY